MKNYLLVSFLLLISDLINSNNSKKTQNEELINQKPKPVFTQCGITSDWPFNNWAKNIVTTAPTVFPKDDSELKNYLKIIKDNKCKARPVGATHSAGGIVLENNSTDSIAISLAKYEPDDKEWRDNIIQENGKSSVRIPTGRSLLDLVSIIRPKNLFTPTQTAGFIFTVGGIMANTVHGGLYGKGFANYYVTKMRVMLSNGDVRIIDDKEEIKYWRQSFGLLGIITSVEIELEERKDFRMDLLVNDFGHRDFTKEEFLNTIANCRKNNEIYGEFFFNAYNLRMHTVTCRNNEGDSAKNDDDCNWSYSSLGCIPAAWCSYQFQWGDYTLNQSCRVKKEANWKDYYDYYKNSYPEIDTKGIPTSVFPGDTYGNQMSDLIYYISKIPGLAHYGTLVKILANLNYMGNTVFIPKSQKESDDGYWVRTSPKATIMAYFFPADKLYEALKIYQNTVYTLLDGTNPVSKYTTFKFNQPCEFRFLTLNSTLASKYQIPHSSDNEYVCIEALNLYDDLEDYNWAFAQLEHEWLTIEGSIPHIGKLWGFDYENIAKGIRPEPFKKEFARGLMTEEQKADFKEYSSKVDPDGTFAGGLAMEFFK